MNEFNVTLSTHGLQTKLFLQSSEKAESANHTVVILITGAGLGVKGHPLNIAQ